MNELSRFIKNISDHNTPSSDYFNNFLPSYKTYHKRQNVRRTVLKAISLASIFIVACSVYVSINNSNELDIPTAAGVEMSNHHLQHGKVVVFEGNVSDVTEFIKKHIKEKTDTISLKEYFNGDDIWGVYVPGEDKFRYYYQCLGHGKYTVFVIND